MSDEAADAPARASERTLARETLKSERLRAALVVGFVGFFGFFVFRWVAVWLFFPRVMEQQTGATVHRPALVALWGVAFAYTLVALGAIQLHIRWDRQPPRFARFGNALVETTIPTLTILLAADASEAGALALVTPVTWGYFLFILAATLRLDFWLCLFTGAACAFQYLGLAIYFIGQSGGLDLDPVLTAPVEHGPKAGLLLGAGVLAGIVSLQIRRQFSAAIRSLEDRNRVVSMFGQHVSPAVVEELLSQDVELAGETRSVCVLFLDIQGFTAFSERRRPEEVVAYLNALFEFMIDSVNRHHGIVNKFLGDGFMAVFGAPISDGQDCRNGVAAAREIAARVDRLVAEGAIPPTRIRIGLHSGEAITGNVGSALRKEYTIIGDVVNLASRLEGMNKQFGSTILASDAVMRALDAPADGHAQPIGTTGGTPATPAQPAPRVEPLGAVEVRGRAEPVAVYRLA